MISAAGLTLGDGAGISTGAASANGGNIAISVAGRLYLLNSRVTTSVDGAKGNGGNITIDPQFVVLNASQIIANAVGGNGGNITIVAGRFLSSTNSIVQATSQLGISGTIDIIGTQVDLDRDLVTLPDELRDAPAVARDACSAALRSTLVDAGRGGLSQDPDTVIPALYLAGRPPRPGLDAMPPVRPVGPRSSMPPAVARRSC